jgi:hypothetical protein
MGPVESAVAKELAGLSGDVAAGGLAALALATAAQIDDPSTSSTSKSMNGRLFADVLQTLLKMAPPEMKETVIDGAAKRHAARRRGAAPAHQRAA